MHADFLFRRHALFDLCNGLARIQVLGTDLGAVHDCVASIQFEGIVQVVQPFLGHFVAGIFDPSIGLHQNGRSQVLVGVPPVAGARR